MNLLQEANKLFSEPPATVILYYKGNLKSVVLAIFLYKTEFYFKQNFKAFMLKWKKRDLSQN